MSLKAQNHNVSMRRIVRVQIAARGADGASEPAERELTPEVEAVKKELAAVQEQLAAAKEAADVALA
eukprot:2658293-Pleurochrysis_carterae.AAC.1